MLPRFSSLASFYSLAAL
uniref:Uncharacterized protein n=1 Tax=Rhizophora mucronata TaxID=61149 RepID=A0A2P2Q3Y5_RHIMU